jgi:hypothetical protein
MVDGLLVVLLDLVSMASLYRLRLPVAGIKWALIDM